MLPRSEMLQRYRQFASDPLSILKAGAQRQMYDDWQAANKENPDGNQKNEGEQAQRDEDEDLEWENFVVVEKIDIYDEQELKELEEID